MDFDEEFLNSDAWRELKKALSETAYVTNSIYSYSVDLNKLNPRQKQKQEDKLSIKEQLAVLMCSINYALDIKDKNAFMESTKEYNKLKLELVR